MSKYIEVLVPLCFDCLGLLWLSLRLFLDFLSFRCFFCGFPGFPGFSNASLPFFMVFYSLVCGVALVYLWFSFAFRGSMHFPLHSYVLAKSLSND